MVSVVQKNQLLALMTLQDQLNEFIADRYYNSQPLIQLNLSAGLTIEFSLTDVMLIAAITQSNVLLWGSSGSGKTLLAELIAQALFGTEHYCRKNITPDMNEQDFMDIDFGAIKAGKKLKEAMTADELFNHSCLIIDEANRAPPIVQNRLMQILENNIDLKSKTVKAGYQYPSGNYYHWNILTLNLGSEYAGTSAIDRALRDRITLDIPIDNFPPTIDDQINMIRKNQFLEQSNLIQPNPSLIYDLYSNLDAIQLSIEAEALILYLSFCSNCVKSQTESKYGIIFSPQFCKDKDCQYARNPPLNKICPFTFAPSNRVLRRLVHVAKGFALLKYAKIASIIKATKGIAEAEAYLSNLSNIEVNLDDVISIAPFVLHSKISMYSEWVENQFNGNTYFASKEFLKIIYEQLDYFIKSILKSLVLEKRGENLSEKDLTLKKRAVKDDFHFDGLIKYVMKYLE